MSTWSEESPHLDGRSEGAQIKKRRGRKLSHNLRLKLFDEVLELRREGYSYSKIIQAIKQKHGVTLTKSYISDWTRGIHNPANEPYNKPDLTPSPELATIAAALIGDGTLGEKRDGAVFEIKMKDLEPIQLIAQYLAKITGKTKPCFIGRLSDGRYYTRIQSRELYNYLKNWENIVQLLQKYPKEFIRMFFECEGGPYTSISQLRLHYGIEADNTNVRLLELINEELTKLGISSKILLKHRIGDVFISKSRGTVVARRDCYAIRIWRVDPVKKFAEKIGFISERKKKKLNDAVEIHEKYVNGIDTVIEWLRRYKYVESGRIRWVRRDQILSRMQAELELQAIFPTVKRALQGNSPPPTFPYFILNRF